MGLRFKFFFLRLFPGNCLHLFLGGIIDSQLEILKHVFRMEFIAKTMFSQKTFIGDSRVDFLCFLEAQGAGFLSFSALETGLKIE